MRKRISEQMNEQFVNRERQISVNMFSSNFKEKEETLASNSSCKKELGQRKSLVEETSISGEKETAWASFISGRDA